MRTLNDPMPPDPSGKGRFGVQIVVSRICANGADSTVRCSRRNFGRCCRVRVVAGSTTATQAQQRANGRVVLLENLRSTMCRTKFGNTFVVRSSATKATDRCEHLLTGAAVTVAHARATQTLQAGTSELSSRFITNAVFVRGSAAEVLVRALTAVEVTRVVLRSERC